MQRTNFKNFITNIFSFFISNFLGPWKSRSIGLISFLLGFYITSQISTYLIDRSVNSILLAITMVLLLELPIRFSVYNSKNRILWVILDYSRIGITYCLVLEAFKLGS